MVCIIYQCLNRMVCGMYHLPVSCYRALVLHGLTYSVSLSVCVASCLCLSSLSVCGILPVYILSLCVYVTASVCLVSVPPSLSRTLKVALSPAVEYLGVDASPGSRGVLQPQSSVANMVSKLKLLSALWTSLLQGSYSPGKPGKVLDFFCP